MLPGDFRVPTTGTTWHVDRVPGGFLPLISASAACSCSNNNEGVANFVWLSKKIEFGVGWAARSGVVVVIRYNKFRVGICSTLL